MSVTCPVFVVRTPLLPRVIPGLVPLEVPEAVKFMQLNVAAALVFVMAAVIEIVESAVSVSSVFALHEIGLETVILPLLAYGPPVCVDVLIVTLLVPRSVWTELASTVAGIVAVAAVDVQTPEVKLPPVAAAVPVIVILVGSRSTEPGNPTAVPSTVPSKMRELPEISAKPPFPSFFPPRMLIAPWYVVASSLQQMTLPPSPLSIASALICTLGPTQRCDAFGTLGFSP